MLSVQVRFLHVIVRQILAFDEGRFEAVPVLEVDGVGRHSCQECREHRIESTCCLTDLLASPRVHRFDFAAEGWREEIRRADGQVVGAMVRKVRGRGRSD